MRRCVVLLVFMIFSVTAGCSAQQKAQVVVLKTSAGEIEIELYPDIAPRACENFVGLVKKGYYNDTIFHRVIKDFMVQGGDPTGTGRGGESIWGNKPFNDEIRPDVTFDREGLLAMANAGPDTNKSQFFITTAPTSWLNGKHTIFGAVTAGYDVVEQIEQCETDDRDRPVVEQRLLEAVLK
jgi:peptidylprolyl isomerase